MKSPAAAEAVGEVAEDEGADDGSTEIEGGAKAELGVGECESIATFEGSGEGAAEAALEAVEQPGYGERGDDAEMPAAPGKAVEPGGDVGDDVDEELQGRQYRCSQCDAKSGVKGLGGILMIGWCCAQMTTSQSGHEPPGIDGRKVRAARVLRASSGSFGFVRRRCATNFAQDDGLLLRVGRRFVLCTNVPP